MKMNLSGRNCVQLYDVDRQNLAIPPQSWVGCAVDVRVLVKSVWIMSKEIGVLYEVQAVQIEPPSSAECPF